MRNTSFPIRYLVAKKEPDDPDNSTGRMIADSVNGLIDLVGALEDNSSWPDPDPSVVVSKVHNSDYPYLAGSEIRTAFGYFRCISNVPANSNISLTNRNFWALTHMPADGGAAYGGIYDEVNGYLANTATVRLTPDNVIVMRALEDIDPGTPFDPAQWQVDATYDRGGMQDWSGTFDDTATYDAGVFVTYNDGVYVSKDKIETAGPFDPTEWDSVFQVNTTTLFNIKCFIQDTTDDDEEIFIEVVTQDFVFKQNFPNSVAVAATAAEADTSLVILHGVTQIGTINFAAGSTSGTFVSTGDVSVTTGDLIALKQNGTADKTLANISITLEGLM
ncbi:hypothetical protein CZP2022_64 [Vibrio phage C-ZP2022]|nr:hypothetical protein CZP2022_64 [Vibrio phage C-ZP2022]